MLQKCNVKYINKLYLLKMEYFLNVKENVRIDKRIVYNT